MDAAEPAARTPRRARLVWSLVRAGVVCLLGGAGGLAGLHLSPGVEGEVGPGRVALTASLGEGATRLELPPAGAVVGDTHEGGLLLTAAVVEVDVGEVEEASGALVAGPLRDELAATAVRELRGLASALAVQGVLAGGAGGALIGVMLPRRRWRSVLLATGAGGCSVAVALGGTWVSYDPSAFQTPRYEGPLSQLPALLETLDADVLEARGRLDAISAQLTEAYGGERTPVQDEVRLLHVSDLHSNPLGAELTASLAEELSVDAVIDTGDTTSFGLALEPSLVAAIARVDELGIPYYLTPGNHDSTANRPRLSAIPGVDLLDGEVAVVGEGAQEVRVLGFFDPTFTASNETSTAEARRRKEIVARSVAAKVAEEAPQILAVHDPVLARESAGLTPLVLAGHTHERSEKVERGTRILTVGSTGAGGIGDTAAGEEPVFHARVLRLRGGVLVGSDYLTLRGSRGQFVLDRALYPPLSLQPPAGAGPLSSDPSPSGR